jgi:hypothetical protein
MDVAFNVVKVKNGRKRKIYKPMVTLSSMLEMKKILCGRDLH